MLCFKKDSGMKELWTLAEYIAIMRGRGHSDVVTENIVGLVDEHGLIPPSSPNSVQGSQSLVALESLPWIRGR